ncbi:hypothetical protein BD324DRAFT_21337 [Kockovaella imperatae]|uniref:Uncharacterized protein n=1 Tax=Kockovaella imperatae TaxID=4999 RepID=A0A1Y1URX0_9TREE|nr:hypothetical protein BD324DRAFT_21337 [Kockovaella imperatae]ORX40791.1 hypothetical protein BD324DRAFT_21337 [Kockovaella imperatae]
MIRSASAETGGSRMSEARSDRASGRQSSGGGSFYDYYNEGEETLVSPQEGSSRRAKTASQAVEITEYADGKLVWSLVDGLRDVDEVDGPEPFGLHSRNTSVDSAYPSEKEDLGDAEALDTQGIAGLNLRHRDRAQPLDRPPTNVSE